MAEDKSLISVGLPADLVGDFDRIAKVLDQDRIWVIQRALALYLEQEGAGLLEEAEGFSQLDDGLASNLDDVLAKASAIVEIAEGKRKRRAF